MYRRDDSCETSSPPLVPSYCIHFTDWAKIIHVTTHMKLLPPLVPSSYCIPQIKHQRSSSTRRTNLLDFDPHHPQYLVNATAQGNMDPAAPLPPPPPPYCPPPLAYHFSVHISMVS
ncbi:hypothetical protein EX30DRAFT_7015 [Ascodesmis nigricans]|uniref:Uncharacterized protein n=1 Tax=Ascodesmis nigricans TaxID=341454 RepID=A0A4S2N663_9PEZI|nr:hypothetical protein EX30DRAFT_7015 [Ascodesmis nigricans]